jgi:hypothetical protein
MEGKPALRLPIGTARQLRAEAERWGVKVEEMASAILANIVADDLFAAVIDR